MMFYLFRKRETKDYKASIFVGKSYVRTRIKRLTLVPEMQIFQNLATTKPAVFNQCSWVKLRGKSRVFGEGRSSLNKICNIFDKIVGARYFILFEP